MQVIYSYIFGMVLLGESISLLGVVGSGLIAMGVLAVNMRAVQVGRALQATS